MNGKSVAERIILKLSYKCDNVTEMQKRPKTHRYTFGNFKGKNGILAILWNDEHSQPLW